MCTVHIQSSDWQMHEHFWHQPDPSGAQDVITTPRNLPSISSTVSACYREQQGEESLLSLGGTQEIVLLHPSKTPKHQTHVIFTAVSKMTLLWISSQPPVLVTCTLPQLNLLSHKKGMKGGRDMPIDLCQQKLNLWPPAITNITLPFPSSWLKMNTMLLSQVSQQDWLSLSEERKPIRN